MERPLKILGIGGTVRPGSSTELAMRSALAAARDDGADIEVCDGSMLVELSMYNPLSRTRNDAERTLVDLVRHADGIVIASPGYHGTISGLVKNALDFTEDLRDDPRAYLTDRPVGIVTTGAGWQAIGSTISAMRSVVHALRGWPTPLAAGVNTTETTFDANGVASDPRALAQLAAVGHDVVTFAHRWASHRLTV